MRDTTLHGEERERLQRMRREIDATLPPLSPEEMRERLRELDDLAAVIAPVPRPLHQESKPKPVSPYAADFGDEDLE